MQIVPQCDAVTPPRPQELRFNREAVAFGAIRVGFSLMQGDEFHRKFAESAEKMDRRTFNTHLFWEMMPKGDNAR